MLIAKPAQYQRRWVMRSLVVVLLLLLPLNFFPLEVRGNYHIRWWDGMGGVNLVQFLHVLPTDDQGEPAVSYR
jgi:hypothetical protein